MNPLKNYKITEIGEIPEEWKVIEFGKLLLNKDGLRRGPWGGSLKKEIFVDSGYKVYEQKAVIHNDFNLGSYYITEEKFQEMKDFAIKPGDFLVTGAGTIGKIVIVPSDIEKGIINQALVRIRLNNNLMLNIFFYYLFNYIVNQKQLENMSHGATLKNLSSMKVLKTLKLPVPPISEQSTIAFILSAVQQAIEKTEAVIQATQELKKSLMNHLFTYGPVPITERGQLQLKETEIGEIPEEWEIVSLNYLVKRRKENVNPSDFDNILYVGLEHIDSGQIHLNRWGSSSEVKSAKNKFYEKDILYGKLRPYLDKAILAEKEGICSTDILVFTASSKTTPEYFVYLIHKSDILKFATSAMTGVNHPRTSWNSLQKYKVALPSEEEQKRIASVLLQVDDKIIKEQNKRKSLESLFKSLLENLMTGKTRVKDLKFKNLNVAEIEL